MGLGVSGIIAPRHGLIKDQTLPLRHGEGGTRDIYWGS